MKNEQITPTQRVLGLLKGVRESGGQHIALCPAHDDKNPSLSVGAGDDGRALLHCHAGCHLDNILAAIGLMKADLFLPKDRTSDKAGCTLKRYAEAKGLPLEFLKTQGLTELTYQGKKAVRMSYRNQDGDEIAVRFRLALTGPDRFRWRKGSKPVPYGLWRLEEARRAGYIILVEGESDCHTLWHHGFPALGIPGAMSWKPEWAEFLNDFPTIYLCVEPDKAGQALLGKLANSPLAPKVHVIAMEDLIDED